MPTPAKSPISQFLWRTPDALWFGLGTLISLAGTSRLGFAQSDREKVLAAIDSFMVGLSRRDTVVMGTHLDSAARFTLFRPDQSGGVRVVVLDGRQFMGAVTGPSSQAFEEPIRNPVVHVDGDLASVWAEYQVQVAGRVTHCGFDAFHLVRRPSGWKVLNVSDSYRSAGCGDRWVRTPAADTVRLEVGSPHIDGTYFQPHAAKVRVYRGPPGSPPVMEWTNELTLGDSAGRKVHRWVTRGSQLGSRTTWELLQTYDARTQAIYGYLFRSSAGDLTSLTINGRHVRGVRKTGGDTVTQQVDYMLDRPSFPAHASDLVPLASRLKNVPLSTAPVWSPGMVSSQLRVFSVGAQVPVEVEGKKILAWKVEERHADGRLYATWYLIDRAPYMVYGEVVLTDGQIQRMTEVSVDTP